MRELWTKDELRILFSSPLYTGCQSTIGRHLPGQAVPRDSLYWAPLVVAGTGLRLNEICQLQVRHLRRDKVTGIWFFDLFDRHLKLLHRSQRRHVPLPNALLELNIIEFLHSNRDESASLLGMAHETTIELGETLGLRFNRYCKSFDKARNCDQLPALYKTGRGIQRLRDYFATQLAYRGVSVECARTLLGNESTVWRDSLFSRTGILEVLKREIDKIDLPIDSRRLAAVPTIENEGDTVTPLVVCS